MRQDVLRSRIEWLLLFRVLFVTVLLGSAIVVNVNNVATFTDGRYIALTGLIVATYLLSITFGILVRRLRRLEVLVHAQLLLDVGLISGVVMLTGGLESIFVFLYFLAVFSGANLLKQTGALVAAAMAATGFLLVGFVQFAAEPVEALAWLQSSSSDVRLPAYNVSVHVFAFFIVAFLSGYLAEKLGSADEALRERELDVASLRQLNEEIVHSVRSGILALDERDRITLANRAACRILGFEEAELVGSRIALTLPVITRALQRAGESVLDVSWTRPDGAVRLVSIYAVPLDLVRREAADRLVVLQDVTEVRDLEAQVRRQAQLAAVGQLSASIAHEIRNPLAAVAGAVEMLRIQEGSERELRLQGIALREVARLNRLVEEFLAYARPREPERSPVQLERLVAEVVEATASARQGVPIVEVHDDRPESRRDRLMLDGDLIRQVIWNLLRNAVKATPDGERVSIGLSEEEVSSTACVVVEVRDRGAGIPPEVAHRLFEPFFTTREGGTGLGLATSLRLVNAHGGRIETGNATGGGAVFRMILPRNAGQRLVTASHPVVATED